MPLSQFVRELHYDKDGGRTSVDVLIGQAQFGEYTVKLYDELGRNPKKIGEGNNADDLSDSFPISKPAGDLENQLLGWTITIASPVEGAGQNYFARVTVLQDGRSVPDGPFEYQGPLDSAKIIIGFARFVA